MAIDLSDSEKKVAIRKITIRLIPLLALGYFFNSLEKTNIGLAALQMNSALGLTTAAFGLAAGLLFVGYALFEIPSNLALYKFGARKWIARIMITWGLVAAATSLVVGEASLYVLRILLGIAEAGFYPGVILYIALWVPRQYRGTMLSLFVLGGTLSAVVGSPLTGLLLSPPDYFGIESWRAMFVIEGIPAVIVGVLCLIFLTDRPKDAKWLTLKERTWLSSAIDTETSQIELTHGPSGSLKMLGDIRVITLSVIYFLLKCGQYSLIFFLPLIIVAFQKEAGTKFSTLQVSLLSAIPALCAVVPAILWARHSDKTGERRWHAAIPAIVGCVGITLSALVDNPVLIMISLCVATVGLTAQSAPFFQMPNFFLTGAAAAASFALINSLGNLGGFVAPTIFGALRDSTGDYKLPSLIMGAFLAIAAIITLALPKLFPSLSLLAHKASGAGAGTAMKR
ncbi:MFS transporter [Subtercola frigoramans]|uniref:MFS family permease n=1 Tax=Subtercola frigoramans TaxID=120298 RepID=A0ABS2L1C1_9MICO|nr:MFS transporter [Subtercola frigoramans]MBM7470873.1 MFS family permease [Subtercola frigoramans]